MMGGYLSGVGQSNPYLNRQYGLSDVERQLSGMDLEVIARLFGEAQKAQATGIQSREAPDNPVLLLL